MCYARVMSAVTGEAHIRIAYDGEALQSGTMDVRDLAPALLALSDLFDEASKVLSGPDRAIQLRIKHDIRKGSFDVGIQVVQTWASKILSLFAGDSASGLANLIEILGLVAGAGYGLIKVVKWLRGRPIKRLEFTDDEGVRLIVDGDELLISRPLAKVLNDVGVRRALAAVMAPLRRDGIESFEVRTAGGEVIETVTKQDAPAFEAPTPVDVAPQQIAKNEFQQAYTIVAVTFKEGNKWRVSDGQSTISVTIEDNEFLRKVNSHDVAFAKDDVIRCDVRQEQSMTSEGLKTEVFIKRILDHKHTYRQAVLPLELGPAQPSEKVMIQRKDAKAEVGAPQAEVAPVGVDRTKWTGPKASSRKRKR
jgi:hypothetical protein